MKNLILLFGFLTLSFTTQADEFLYILSAKAKLLSKPSYGAQTIERITKGQRVTTLDKTNHWFKVQHKEKIGWISRLAVSPNPPMKRVSLLAKKDTKLRNQARRRASAITTTAAVRGLRGDSRNRISDSENENFTALAKMETFNVSTDKVEQFIDNRPEK